MLPVRGAGTAKSRTEMRIVLFKGGGLLHSDCSGSPDSETLPKKAGERKVRLLPLHFVAIVPIILGMSAPLNSSAIRDESFLDSTVYRYSGNLNAAAPQMTLFLHGFPAESGKNEDLAAEVAGSLHQDVYLLHYRGLGNALGSFSFAGSIREALAVARTLLDRYPERNLNLVGHSWGGLVALNLLTEVSEARIHRVFLMAPLTFLPPPELHGILAAGYVDRERRRGRSVDEGALAQDFETVRRDHAPVDLIPRLGAVCKRTKIVQGIEDTIVPSSATRAFVARCVPAPFYEEFTESHWFADRSRIRRLCREWLVGT